MKRWKSAQSSSLTWLTRRGGLPSEMSLAPGDRALALAGEHGIGKTWLLRHLAEEERRLSSQVAYLDLEERSRFPCPEDYVRAVERQIEQQCLEEQVVLLLDAVPPQMDGHLRALEETVLRPCLQHRSALVIMALVRPSQLCWRAPALRGGHFFQLGSFDDAATLDQLRFGAGLSSDGQKPGLRGAVRHITLALAYDELVAEEYFDIIVAEERLHKRILREGLGIGELHSEARGVAQDLGLRQPTRFQEFLTRMFGSAELWS